MTFAKIEDAIAAVRSGSFVVVVDDAGRENEGDLIISAQCATPEALAFMVRYTSGIICVAATPERLDTLELPLMVDANSESHGTAFTVSVDLKHGTSTGISAADRSLTIRALADERFGAADFARPGHVFPLRYAVGGVLSRPGHTEAAVDLARLAGHPGAGALCEIVSHDGSMARLPELRAFAAHHDCLIVNIADLIAYRLRHEPWKPQRTATESTLGTRQKSLATARTISRDETEHSGAHARRDLN